MKIPPLRRPDIDNVLMEQILVVFDAEHKFVAVKSALVVGYEVEGGGVRTDKTIQLELKDKKQLGEVFTKEQVEAVTNFHKALVDYGLKQV